MSDWYTDAVKQALEIVPVEWYDKAGAKYRAKYSTENNRNGGWRRQAHLLSFAGGHWEGLLYDRLTGYEALALVEKAFREWLDEKTADALAWGFYEGLWAVWISRFGKSTFFAEDEPTYTELLAKAVLELDKRERNYGSVDK